MPEFSTVFATTFAVHAKTFDICVEPRLRAPTPARWMKAPNVGDQGRIFAEKRFVPGQTAFSLGTGALCMINLGQN
jgi:hypothetical protein